MLKEKINTQLRKRFLQEIIKTKETGIERGFHICIEKDGKLSAGTSCSGDNCGLFFQSEKISCPNKKVQGDFHTHPYLKELKKEFGITFSSSKKLIKSATEKYLDLMKENKISPTMPSHGDANGTILGKCAKSIEGTMCIGSDLDLNKIECWTTNNSIEESDCAKALVEKMSNDLGGPPKEWIKPLFDKEIIKLK